MIILILEVNSQKTEFVNLISKNTIKKDLLEITESDRWLFSENDTICAHYLVARLKEFGSITSYHQNYLQPVISYNASCFYNKNRDLFINNRAYKIHQDYANLNGAPHRAFDKEVIFVGNGSDKDLEQLSFEDLSDKIPIDLSKYNKVRGLRERMNLWLGYFLPEIHLLLVDKKFINPYSISKKTKEKKESPPKNDTPNYTFKPKTEMEKKRQKGIDKCIPSEKYRDFIVKDGSIVYDFLSVHMSEDEFKHQRGQARIGVKMLADIYNISTEECWSRIKDYNETGNLSVFNELKSNRVSAYILKPNLSFNSQNVVGYIQGKDSSRAVVLSAHYDTRFAIQGANDNASGCSALLSIANSLAKACKMGYQPDYNIIFLFSTNEEYSSVGVRYFLNHLPNPELKIVANLNLDMLGGVDKKHRDSGNSNYTYVVGSNFYTNSFEELNLKHARLLNLEIDNTLNCPSNEFIESSLDLNRKSLGYFNNSDSYYFSLAGIPSVFYFDNDLRFIHQTTDTPEEINYEKIEKISKLVFMNVWEMVYNKYPIQLVNNATLRNEKLYKYEMKLKKNEQYKQSLMKPEVKELRRENMLKDYKWKFELSSD